MFWRSFVLAIALCTGIGCDGTPPPPAKTAAKPIPWAQFTSLTPLPVNRRTHIAAIGGGTIYWVQETDAGRDIAFAMNDGALPVATRLTSAAICEKLAEPAGTGNIQSLVGGSDSKLYFFFAGGKGRKSLTVLGSFSPSTSEIKILADAGKLKTDTALGDSLVLARATLVRNADTIWLWLRHDDGFALTSFSTAQPNPQLRRPFESVTDVTQSIELTSPREDLTAGPDNSLVYLDRKHTQIWTIDSRGTASLLQSTKDLPQDLSTPQVDSAGNMLLFAPQIAAATDPDDPASLGGATPDKNTVAKFPAVITWFKNQRVIIDRDHMDVPARISVRELKISEFARFRTGWLGYNSQTGDLLRMQLVEK